MIIQLSSQLLIINKACRVSVFFTCAEIMYINQHKQGHRNQFHQSHIFSFKYLTNLFSDNIPTLFRKEY